jgi:hypothetical protein
VTLAFDLVPGRSSFVLQFEPRGATPAATQEEYPDAVSAAYEHGEGKCPKCLGDGRVAGGTDDLDAWPVWAALPPGSDLAVRMGLVYPITCPACGGTGEP